MPPIEDRLRDAGEVWRNHVDGTAARRDSAPRSSRRGRHTRRAVLVAAAAVVVVGAGVPAAGVLAHHASDHAANRGGVAASCAGPRLRLVGEQKHSRTAVVRTGQELTVTGRFYLDQCQDTNHVPDPRPLTVDIVLHGHDDTVRLRTVQAHGELGTFRSTVRIPVEYPLGETRITTHTTGPQVETAAGLPMQPIRLTVVK